MAFPKNACIVSGKPEEVVLPGESAQIVDTAGGPTSSGASRHLTLAGSLGPTAPLKGKAFGCGGGYRLPLWGNVIN